MEEAPQQEEQDISSHPNEEEYTGLPNPVEKARNRADLVVLIITIIISILIFLWFAGVSLAVFYLLLAALVATLFYIRILQVSLLANSLRVQNGRHAYMLEIANEITSKLDVPPVDIYITQNPVLNAYAIGHARPYSIVLNSSIVEELEPHEIKSILIHEIGHIVYHHTVISSYLTPLSSVVPIIGPAVSWVFGFWSRRAEKTCDRLSLAYTGDFHTVAMALIKVHVGSNFAQYMSEEGVIYQDIKGRGLMRRLAQTLPTHPFLVTRIRALISFAEKNSIPLPQNVQKYLASQGTANGREY